MGDNIVPCLKTVRDEKDNYNLNTENTNTIKKDNNAQKKTIRSNTMNLNLGVLNNQESNKKLTNIFEHSKLKQ